MILKLSLVTYYYIYIRFFLCRYTCMYASTLHCTAPRRGWGYPNRILTFLDLCAEHITFERRVGFMLGRPKILLL